MDRIRDGYVNVMSPFSSKISTVPLLPENVIAIVFWTKNARPMVRHISELRARGYTMYFLYTVNNYPRELEPCTPNVGHTINTLEAITGQFGQRVIRWRYDPLVITRHFSADRCIENFDYLCSVMKLYSDQCIFSPCDYYKKTIQKMSRMAVEFIQPDKEQLADISSKMSDIASRHGVSLLSCAHDYLVGDGIGKAKCIDPDFIKSLVESADVKNALTGLKTPRSRPECDCAQSVDIGAYNTCLFNCVYCYATKSIVARHAGLIKSVRSADCLDPRVLSLSH